MGGEPTFISIDDMDGAEWNTEALGPHKRRLAADLLLRLRGAFAPGSLVHFGQGKWYPGESLPRWAFSCFWRRDGVPVWRDERLLAVAAPASTAGADGALRFGQALCAELGAPADFLIPAHEDAVLAASAASRKPAGKSSVAATDTVAGYVLPLKPAPRPDPAAPTAA